MTDKPYYDGSPGRELVICPDCGEDAVAQFGDHGGPEVCARRLTPGGSIRLDKDRGYTRLAEQIIRDVARTHQVFSSNDTRAAMDAKGIPVTIRVRLFRELVGEVMEPAGFTDSTEARPRGRMSAKPRQVRTYRSMIFDPKAATA